MIFGYSNIKSRKIYEIFYYFKNTINYYKDFIFVLTV